MVTAIVIPILIIYFFLLAKKDRKKHRRLWNEMEDVKKESVIDGKITEVYYEKKRYYYDFHIVITHITILKNGKLYRAEMRERLTKEWEKQTFTKGDNIKLIGYWENQNLFIFGEYYKIK